MVLTESKTKMVLTCVSLSCRALAISIRRARVKYLLKWNSFSNSVNCLFVKFVRPELLLLLFSSRELLMLADDKPVGPSGRKFILEFIMAIIPYSGFQSLPSIEFVMPRHVSNGCPREYSCSGGVTFAAEIEIEERNTD